MKIGKYGEIMLGIPENVDRLLKAHMRDYIRQTSSIADIIAFGIKYTRNENGWQLIDEVYIPSLEETLELEKAQAKL